MLVDELDLLLMKELETDARQGINVLAEKLGAKRTTVAYRLKRLIDRRIITIAAIANRESLGYGWLYVIGMNVSPARTAAIAERLVPMQSIKTVFLTTGRFDIVTWALFRNRSELLSFLSDLGKISDVVNIDTILSFQLVKKTWKYFTPQPDIPEIAADEGAQNGLSELEVTIIKELELAPSQTMKELAGKVGGNRAAVTRRFQELTATGAIAFVSIVDPKALGYNIQTFLLVKVKPDEIQSVASELAHLDMLRHISLITGDCQIIVSAVFKDIPQMYEFLNNTLSRIPGIVRYHTIPVVKTVKYSFRLLT